MSIRVDLQDRERGRTRPVPGPPDAQTPPQHAAMMPSPWLTLGAGAVGLALGFTTVFLLAELRANPLVGVGVIVVLFALALAGSKFLPNARTETGRTVALALNSLAFGGVLAGLAVELAG